MTIFALHSSEAGLVLERAGDALLWRHLGLPVETTGLPPLARTRGAATFSLDEDMPFATAPGLGWFGPLAVSVAGRVLRWAVTDVAADADSLRFTLTDADTGLLLEQCFRLAPGGGFAISATMGNNGPVPIVVDHLASALLPLPAGLDRILSWRGRHAAEFVESVEPLPAHQWRRETRRGLPGHGGPPGLYLLGQGADWDQGLVLAAQLAWSGDAALAVERDDDGRHVLSAGAADGFTLQPGERFEAPPLLLAISGQGRNGAMQQMHGLVRARLDWPGQAMRPRPVHLNSWEACYFRHDEARILGLARAAAAIGVERFILDDGWFLGRNHDHAGLGDWTADPAKYPDGLKPLAQGVNALGLEFGLWVEPEMVNPDSDLYRTHPDWALHVPSAPQPTARNQLVLNLSLPAVEDYLFAALDTLLSDVPIAYLKWDHNRELAPAGGLGQVQGLYRLLARLRAAHPHVEIESCAGGGGRIDVGIAAFTHRFWTSDNLDAVSRATIQRGFQAFFPPELMGAHVGASPAHATGRRQSLGFRAGVALPGHFGVEMDPSKLPETEQAELAGWIAFHKQWRHLLHGQTLAMGEGADGLVWQASGDGAEWVLFVTRIAPPQDRRPQPLTLPFLAGAAPVQVRLLARAGTLPHKGFGEPEMLAALSGDGVTFPANWLAHAGLPLPPLLAEIVAVFHLKA
ncbi:alpha-galactosidase [Sandarakinorhabdus limnophila]|uniref:alpha-galactosidase n=1 Tax=Sandarakinorhabdus limnophila TaxID=210512 RepID=UPI0026F1E9C3|nr:alpha-galactosidase [Sandarakinorhabdus limnophila]